MINWKTKVPAIGALLVLVGGMIQHPDQALSPLNIGGLMAALGLLFAKQNNVTGGDVGQPSTPEALTVANVAHSAVSPPVSKS